MKKLIATVSIVTALGAGAFLLNSVLPAGAVGSTTTQAADPSSGCGGPRAEFKQVLDKLAADGTITADQETAIIQAFKDARQSAPSRPETAGRRLKVLSGMVDVAAGQLNMSADDLKAALQSGKSVADVAAENGVNPSDIVSAIVDAGSAKVDQAVTSGKLTQDQGDKVKGRLANAADAFVNHTPKSC